MVRSLSIDKNGIRKGEWSKEEDDKLKNYINRYGTWNWRQLPQFAGLSRCGKSCRLRWKNYLQPNVKRGNYSKEEEDIIINLHQQFGKKWSVIAKKLPGRTDNEIKNYWHTHLKKRTQGQHQISLSSNQENIELLKDENNQQQISTPHSQGLTSPNESFCTKLSQDASDLFSWVQKDCDNAKSIESSADFLNQKLKIEDYESPQGSSCSKISFSCSDAPNLSDLMNKDTTNTPTYLDDFWSLTDNYMINEYTNQQPLVDVYPTSPFTEEAFLWSY